MLIHSGSGGVGQAAISISLSLGCEVFTTVGSQQKIDFLMSKFPQLSRDHILYSRSAKFEEDIMNMTKSKGVNVVLNSLAGDKLQVCCFISFNNCAGHTYCIVSEVISVKNLYFNKVNL